MSHFTSQKASFMHIFRKYGVASVKNHTFLALLKERSDKSEKWFSIDRELAQMLVQLRCMQEKVMCREVDLHNRSPDDTDYIAVYKTDLDENKQFPGEWKTFVVNL